MCCGGREVDGRGPHRALRAGVPGRGRDRRDAARGSRPDPGRRAAPLGRHRRGKRRAVLGLPRQPHPRHSRTARQDRRYHHRAEARCGDHDLQRPRMGARRAEPARPHRVLQCRCRGLRFAVRSAALAVRERARHHPRRGGRRLRRASPWPRSPRTGPTSRCSIPTHLSSSRRVSRSMRRRRRDRNSTATARWSSFCADRGEANAERAATATFPADLSQWPHVRRASRPSHRRSDAGCGRPPRGIGRRSRRNPAPVHRRWPARQPTPGR